MVANDKAIVMRMMALLQFEIMTLSERRRLELLKLDFLQEGASNRVLAELIDLADPYADHQRNAFSTMLMLVRGVQFTKEKEEQ